MILKHSAKFQFITIANFVWKGPNKSVPFKMGIGNWFALSLNSTGKTLARPYCETNCAQSLNKINMKLEYNNTYRIQNIDGEA